MAPPLDPTRANPLSTAASFLYTGDRPIQAGVAPGAIDPVRVSVLRGRAIGLDGAPLSGVHVTVQGHPELGSTRTRADGWYDLAVNAGTRVVLQYAKDGFLPAQRNAEPVGQGFAPVDDVALARLDPRVSAVDFARPVSAARGSVVSDADGSRQATLFFEGGTTAEMVMPDGSTRPLSSVHVRVTELSVGEHGRAAVPGTLPGAAEYAYGVDLRVEEAAAAGAAQVRFSRPVTLYVENFVGFPDGTAVPTGHYDPATASWVPTDDGRVVRILSVDGGAATLDLDGDGAAEGDSALAALGITLAERQELASTYAAGQSLWRVRVSHFSNWWCGWPYNLPPDARYPDGDYEPEKEKDCVDLESGSVIECQNQALGQRVAVAGTRYTLNYRSTRAPGRTAGRTLQITLSRDQVPENLRRIDLHVFVAGQAHKMSFDPAPNRTHTFTWDGKDAYGRDVQGGAAIDVRVGWVFDYTYTTPAPKLKRTFGAASGQRLPCEYVCGYNREPPQRTLWQAFTDTLRVWNAGAHGKLGGWTLEPHHAYDPVGRTLYRGDGERRSAATQHLQMGTVAGTGKWECGYWNARYDCIGDGGPAKEAQLYEPTGVAFGPDGSQYIVEWRGNRVRRVAPDGTITTVAGTGDWCDYGDLDRDCGDGGPATQAKLSFPSKVAVAPDGTLYIADTYNTAIRRVAPDGTITTVAGNNTFCSTARTWPCGDGVPGTEAHLDYVRDVALHPDGSLYIADAGNGLIRRLTPDGIVTIVAGDGTADGCWEMTGPRPAREVCLSYPEGLAFGEDGSVYIAEGWMDRVLRLAPDGILHVVAGGTDGCYPHDAPCGDGGPATQAQMAWPQALAFGRDGALYVSDAGNDRVRRFEVGGTIRTVAGTGSSVGCTRSTDLCGDGGHAAAAQLGWPDQLAFGPDGGLYIADTFNGKVRRISPPLPGFTDADAAVVSDDGAELYHFDDRGRHLRTLDPQTGIELFRFAYDAAGLLAGVTDADGKTTTVERGPDGTALAVVAPGGERTALAMDGAGWLAEVASPAGHVRAEYTPGGLMTALVDPRGNRRGYTFDGAGRLERAEDPAGGSLTLARAADAAGDGVTVTTAGAKTRGYRVEELPGGGERRVTTTAAGLSTTVTHTPRGVWTTRWADGTTRTLTEGADPRFGSQSPTLKGLTLATPGGRTLSLSGARRATLADPANPLSLTAQLDSVTVNGRSYTTAFDAVGRVLTHTTPTGRQSATRLDAAGRIVEARPAGLEPVRYEYDAGGRLAATVHGGRRRTLEYDAAGRIERVTDPLGRSETYVYDAAGRLAVQRLPDGREIAYGYDAGGNLASVTPPSRPAHALAYTPLDREGAYTAPAVGADSAALRYVYNADRQVDRVVRPDGGEIVFGYDGGGRLQTVETPVGTTSLAYDAATGKVASITAPGGGTLAYAYDGWLPLQTTWSGEVSGSVAMRYNADLWVVAQKVNGDSVPFAYDRDGLLTRAGALTVARAAASGLVTGTTLGSVTTRRGYTPLGELSGDTVRFGAALLYASAYTRDALGRVAGAVETVGGATAAYVFDYDSAGRLRTVTRDGVAVESYAYDDNGNRTYAAGPGGAASADYDAQDRLVAYGDAAYAFGAGGELRTRAVGADTTRYTYDALGNLRAAELAGGTRIDYLVDGQNRRIGKKVDGVLVQGFLYQDQLRPVAELDGAGQVRTRFVYGTRAGVPDYMVRDGRTYRIVADPRGSVRMVVDAATGAVAQRIDYDAYGRVLLDTNPGFQPFGFGGGLYDRHTGLVRLGARDYEAGTGRWTARDPRGFASGNANLYAYVGGDPVNYVDPDGQIAFLAFVWALVEGGLTAMDIWDVLKEMLSACPDKGKALAAAGSLLAGAFLPGGNYDDIPVIGRWFDTAVAEAWPGHRTLNIPQQQWTPEINRGWIQDIIDRGQDVYLASPQTIENIWDNARDALRPFGEELMQLLDAGYRQVGDWMRAPGNAPRPRPSGRPNAAGAAAAGVAGAAAICKCP
ncbi:MAG TPA: RHS repeat-associated core domain-containing protein [Longimicrobium sp.]|nr:RHS repeat-associated core domain-containing protein [Longimicrobium sp.]